MKVCYVQSYRAPDYVRGRTLRTALSKMDGVSLHLAVNVSHGIERYWETIFALLKVRRAVQPDAYVLGFRGHDIAWLVRTLTRGKPLLFDAMMSPYAAITEEHKLGWIGHLLAPLWRSYEHWLLRSADGVLVDTQLHAAYYRDEFDVPEEKLAILPVGASEPANVPAPFSRQDDELNVLFYGSFLPLHGVGVILDAAAQLKDLPIRFHFIGGTTAQAAKLRHACANKGITRYTHRPWVNFYQLLQQEIPAADVCLGGPFGATPQGLRVVTGKAQQSLALGKVTIVGRIDNEFGFVDKHNCLLVRQNDSVDLAAALRWALENRSALQSIGTAGLELYRREFSSDVAAQRLQPMLHALVDVPENA